MLHANSHINQDKHSHDEHRHENVLKRALKWYLEASAMIYVNDAGTMDARYRF